MIKFLILIFFLTWLPAAKEFPAPQKEEPWTPWRVSACYKNIEYRFRCVTNKDTKPYDDIYALELKNNYPEVVTVSFALREVDDPSDQANQRRDIKPNGGVTLIPYIRIQRGKRVKVLINGARFKDNNSATYNDCDNKKNTFIDY